jgi:hypothetical protein
MVLGRDNNTVSKVISIVPFVTSQGLFINEMCNGRVVATHGPMESDHVYELETRGVDPGKNTSKRNRRISIEQEDKVAAAIGGRRQPASGAIEGMEGDVRKIGVVRVECKWTHAASYKLDLSTLTKIEREAGRNEVPALVLSFRDKRTSFTIREYAVIPYEDWLKYVEEWLNAENNR